MAIVMAPVDSRDYVLSGIYYYVLVLVYTRRTNAGPMLAHRLRRWPSIKPALVQRLVFAGLRSIIAAGLATITSRH